MTRQLEQKYIVLKVDKVKLMVEEGDFPLFLSYCFALMTTIGHSYFVMNLDEPEAVEAMEYYFKLKGE